MSSARINLNLIFLNLSFKTHLIIENSGNARKILIYYPFHVFRYLKGLSGVEFFLEILDPLQTLDVLYEQSYTNRMRRILSKSHA